MNTPYDLSFRADKDHVSLCSKQLTQSEIAKFRKVLLLSEHCMLAAMPDMQAAMYAVCSIICTCQTSMVRLKPALSAGCQK